MEQEEKLCHEVEAVRKLTYLYDRVSAGGGCEATVTARMMWWVMFRECGELIYGMRFPIRLQQWAIHKGYVWPAILYGNDTLCL